MFIQRLKMFLSYLNRSAGYKNYMSKLQLLNIKVKKLLIFPIQSKFSALVNERSLLLGKTVCRRTIIKLIKCLILVLLAVLFISLLSPRVALAESFVPSHLLAYNNKLCKAIIPYFGNCSHNHYFMPRFSHTTNN